MIHQWHYVCYHDDVPVSPRSAAVHVDEPSEHADKSRNQHNLKHLYRRVVVLLQRLVEEADWNQPNSCLITGAEVLRIVEVEAFPPAAAGSVVVSVVVTFRDAEARCSQFGSSWSTCYQMNM